MTNSNSCFCWINLLTGACLGRSHRCVDRSHRHVDRSHSHVGTGYCQPVPFLFINAALFRHSKYLEKILTGCSSMVYNLPCTIATINSLEMSNIIIFKQMLGFNFNHQLPFNYIVCYLHCLSNSIVHILDLFINCCRRQTDNSISRNS